jgi:hypothetical protein
MHVELKGGGYVNHEFHCCETRDKVDSQLDKLHDSMTTVFHADYGKHSNVPTVFASYTDFVYVSFRQVPGDQVHGS